MKKKFTLINLLLICVFIMAQMRVGASEILSASHNLVKDDTLYVYVENPGEYEEVKCQIGQKYSPNVIVKGITDSDISINTYILIDNSLSIQEKYRETMKQVAKDLIFSGKSNESFTIATFDTEIHYLVENSQDQEALIGTVEQIEFQDLDTQVTNVLYHLYEKIEDDNENNYKRIILMSDGVEAKTIGYTKEELIEKAKESGYPVYMLGCAYKSNETELENMFRISRETNAEYYFLEEENSADKIAASIGSSFNRVRVQAKIPRNQRDGALKGVKIIFTTGGNEKTVSFNQIMPFLVRDNIQTEKNLSKPENTGQPGDMEPITEKITEAKTEKITEKTEITEITEAKTEKETATKELSGTDEKNFPVQMIVIVAGFLLVVSIVFAVIIFKKKNNRKIGEEKTEQKEHTDTEFLTDGNIESLNKQDGDIITIRLTDIRKPSVMTEYPLSSSVVLGRVADKSEIIFDYEKSVSGQHCKLIRSGDKVYVQDLDSVNGTYINGEIVKEKMELTDGAIIRMGRLQIKFEKVISDVPDEHKDEEKSAENGTGTEYMFEFK